MRHFEQGKGLKTEIVKAKVELRLDYAGSYRIEVVHCYKLVFETFK